MRITINPDSSVYRHGMDTPKGTRVHQHLASSLGGLLPETVRMVAVAVPAHKTWVGRNAYQNTGAQIIIYRVTADDGEGNMEVEEALRLDAKAQTALASLEV